MCIVRVKPENSKPENPSRRPAGIGTSRFDSVDMICWQPTGLEPEATGLLVVLTLPSMPTQRSSDLRWEYWPMCWTLISDGNMRMCVWVLLFRDSQSNMPSNVLHQLQIHSAFGYWH